MEKILVTGGAGFVGSSLVNFLEKDFLVYVIDDLSMGNKRNLNKSENIIFIEGSVINNKLMSDVLSNNNFSYIFHLAAIASVADSVERPIETHKVNFDSVLLLLELCKKYQGNLKRLLFSSSAAVYGDEPTLPKGEESIIRPLTPYAIDKFSSEQYVIDYFSLYGVPTSAVRFFNVYGPKQNPNSPYSGVISILVDKYKKMQQGKQCSFNIFGDGEQSRDFVYIEDVVEAMIYISKNEKAVGEQYNIGTGQSTSLNVLIDTINNILQLKLETNVKESRVGDIKNSVANINKLRNLGYHPQTKINQGMEKYLKYVMNDTTN